MLISKASTAWDVYAFGIPLLALLFIGFFKLDEIFTGRKVSKPLRKRAPAPVEHTPSQMRQFEVAMQSDPDGRSWSQSSRAQR